MTLFSALSRLEALRRLNVSPVSIPACALPCLGQGDR